MPAGASSEYDRVLKALVYQAWAQRGTPALRQTAQEIVDTHARWPLVQYAIELRYARTVQRARARWIAESVAVMRDTYPARERVAA